MVEITHTQEQQTEIEKQERKIVRLAIVEGAYVEKPQEWVTHRRGKNYIARIIGFDKDFGLRREFLEHPRVGRRTYFLLKDFKVDEVYEIKCIYYSARGNEHVYLDGFFICKEINEKEVVLEEISQEEMMKIIREKYGITEEIVKVEKEIEINEKLYSELKVKISMLEQLKASISFIQQELQRKESEIDKNEVDRMREELKNRILKICDTLRELKLVKSYSDVEIYEKSHEDLEQRIKVEVKFKFNKQENKYEYIYINDWVYGKYGWEEDILKLFKRYKLLKEHFEFIKKSIENIKNELKS